MLESLFHKIEEETPAQLFSCEYYKISKNGLFIEHLRTSFVSLVTYLFSIGYLPAFSS